MMTDLSGILNRRVAKEMNEVVLDGKFNAKSQSRNGLAESQGNVRFF